MRKHKRTIEICIIGALMALGLAFFAMPAPAYGDTAGIVLFGDVNSDEAVTAADVGLLRAYLAGFPVEIDHAAADVTRTGYISAADVGMIRAYLAGFPVVLGQPMATPSPTPPPTPSPFPIPSSPPMTEAERRAQFEYTRSAIQLPDRRQTSYERQAWIYEYNQNGGPSAFELNMINLVNQARAHYGLSILQIDDSLMMAARFYTQTLANHDLVLSSRVGPYGGSRNTLESFGARTNWSGGSGNGGGWSYTAIFNNWMRSPGHRTFILAPSHNYIGFGSHLGGRHGVFHYLLLSGVSRN